MVHYKIVPRFKAKSIDFNNPSGSTLGLFTAIQNIGGFCSLFFGARP